MDDIISASASSNADDEHDPEVFTIAFERLVAALLAQARAHLAERPRRGSRLDARHPTGLRAMRRTHPPGNGSWPVRPPGPASPAPRGTRALRAGRTTRSRTVRRQAPRSRPDRRDRPPRSRRGILGAVVRLRIATGAPPRTLPGQRGRQRDESQQDDDGDDHATRAAEHGARGRPEAVTQQQVGLEERRAAEHEQRQRDPRHGGGRRDDGQRAQARRQPTDGQHRAAAPDDEVGRPRQTVRPQTDPRPEAGESGAAGAAGEQEAGGRPHGCDGDERDGGQPQRQRPRGGLLADQEHEQVRRDRERQPALGEHEEAERTGHSPARRLPAAPAAAGTPIS